MADVHQEEIQFTPSPYAVIDSIVPNYLSGMIYSCLVESYASEHNSRMMAMDTATTSANEMLKNLSVRLQPGAPGSHHPGDHRGDRRREGAEKEEEVSRYEYWKDRTGHGTCGRCGI